jgi:phenylpyruvate tautomerase PptA (4-oxalocrotonate tautomerase family)
MPILEYHLAQGQHSDAQIGALLTASSRLYADTLGSPIERVRVLATLHAPQHVAVGGQLLSEGGMVAPHFHFLVLEGRPLDQCHALIAGFTELLVQHLGVARQLVRGGCWPIPPQDWGIAGIPASATRAAEIQARAAASAVPMPVPTTTHPSA